MSAIDLASVAVVTKFNKLEGAELQLFQATRPPSLKQRRFSNDFKAYFNIIVCGVFFI